jgi:hypothetical protein
MTDRILDAKVYRIAASRVFYGHEEFSCLAVGSTADNRRSPQRERYADFMLGGELSKEVKSDLWKIDDKSARAAREVRVLLLLFMAAVVESGDA